MTKSKFAVSTFFQYVVNFSHGIEKDRHVSKHCEHPDCKDTLGTAYKRFLAHVKRAHPNDPHPPKGVKCLGIDACPHCQVKGKFDS